MVLFIYAIKQHITMLVVPVSWAGVQNCSGTDASGITAHLAGLLLLFCHNQAGCSRRGPAGRSFLALRLHMVSLWPVGLWLWWCVPTTTLQLASAFIFVALAQSPYLQQVARPGGLLI
eukprot:GHUV01036954.1.p1 GENE.GHUV01036954.1~~GHUV01036954.1.p1  ORF type:complete len:118 (-),score=9.75 GHUV01036954.1:1-354(-)